MSATSARRIAAAERRRQAVELRRTGASYAQIGTALGITRGRAHKAVMEALEEVAQETRDETERLKALELERLDRLQYGIWRAAQNGNLGAVDRALKIMARRAALLGLDAPQKHAATDPTGNEEREPGVVLIPQGYADVDEWLKQHSQTDG